MAMIAMTIISSIRVKPFETRFMFFTTNTLLVKKNDGAG
jgi:hypothetical protein